MMWRWQVMLLDRKQHKAFDHCHWVEYVVTSILFPSYSVHTVVIIMYSLRCMQCIDGVDSTAHWATAYNLCWWTTGSAVRIISICFMRTVDICVVIFRVRVQVVFFGGGGVKLFTVYLITEDGLHYITLYGNNSDADSAASQLKSYAEAAKEHMHVLLEVWVKCKPQRRLLSCMWKEAKNVASGLHF